MGLVAAAVLTILVLAYIFWPERNPFLQKPKTRLDFLRERREVLMDNLRDLNFEYRAGKYPEHDYEQQRSSMEQETAAVLSEIEHLERG